ncbi:tagatose-6-phosphate kinase/1-phosphofructokinase/sedoheptulokinase [Acididesulfobacillus acetoxydans]|uniref:Tagatose-6-phosphate kinase n=1 Tax=Acididesulfobacillus acetoxydans TaxID=1561005 RepID=A0A8S0WEG8_9FIRM|nr:1-phosphofructokinase [Acididesulfobacillus acetoxydans]CAA7600112.1 tagatose-6-phosphate kinase/1-phosphofructokinase/sedoheptulokinase [Acididesulfobacillus acetoxydans]CEJ07644.1 1-phosphofructokinase [Acididesulfobacillus acetoxydans]
MITTLTLNPAVDKTSVVAGLTFGGLNRVQETMQSPGGKGINVSKALTRLGTNTLVLGISAGDTGKWIERYLQEKNIPYDFVQGSGQTRTNLKVFDQSTETITEFNESGSPVDRKMIDEIIQKARQYAEQSEFLVLGGSVPAGVREDIYSELISSLKDKVKIVLDADGALLAQGIEASPCIIKPNVYELEKLFNRKLESEEEILACGKTLLRKGIAKVVISMGAAGSLLVSDEGCYKVLPVKVPVKSTVGAGDSMVAGFLHGLSRGRKVAEALRLAAACATAAVMTEGSETFAVEVLESVLPDIQVQEV